MFAPMDSTDSQFYRLDSAYSTTSETTRFMHHDLCKKLPLFALSDKDKDLYWDDGIHLTAKGYDRMGEIAFEVLKPLVTGEGRQ